ncbi:MAG: hypothetical protein JOZ27_05035 [Caulobacteraceae bacterium]|nr:hypothetical protein [Caulobacteraceae bacterium]
MDDAPDHPVDPCKTEPCKSSLDAYQTALAAANAACDATQKAIDSKPTAQSMAAAAAGVACGVIGTILVFTGVGAPAGLGVAWGGAALAAISAKLAIDWANAVADARAACSKAHDALDKAKDKVTADCPKQCWPTWTYRACP